MKEGPHKSATMVRFVVPDENEMSVYWRVTGQCQIIWMCIESCERGWLSLLLVIGVICLQMLIVTRGKIERGWIFFFLFFFFVWGSGAGNWQVLSEADWPHLVAQRILRQTLWSSEWLDVTSSGLFFFFPVCAFILCREWYTTAFKSFLQWFIWTAGGGEKKKGTRMTKWQQSRTK